MSFLGFKCRIGKIFSLAFCNKYNNRVYILSQFNKNYRSLIYVSLNFQ
ncbi:hypothetical protein TH15OA1_410003 [Vibrio harveyi]|nr:hypothetical protein TH15OA1_410003 [Vibrio harveyi]